MQNNVKEQVRTGIISQMRAHVRCHQSNELIIDDVYLPVRDQVWNQINYQVWQQVWNQLIAEERY